MTIRLTLLTFLLLAASASAQDPSPIRFLPGDDETGPAPFDQELPAIARGDDQYLVAWVDYRTGSMPPLPLDQSGADVFAARLDADGHLLDAVPILITQAAADQTDPRVAWNGENWLVTWVTQTPTAFFWEYQIHAVRVAPDGAVLDAEPIIVWDPDDAANVAHTLTGGDGNWLVAARGAFNPDIVGIRVAPDGTVLDPGGDLLVDRSSLSINLDLAFAGDEYLLIYDAWPQLKALRLSPELQPLDPAPFTITTSEELEPADARVTSDGTDFFVVWEDDEEVRGARVSHGGDILDPAGLDIGSAFSLENPRVAWDGTHYVVTFWVNNFFPNDDDLKAARVTPGGTVLDPGGVEISPGSPLEHGETEIAGRSGGGVQVAWETAEPSGGPTAELNVSTVAVSPDLVAGSPEVVTIGMPAQRQVDVAAGVDGYMVVFRSDVSGDHRIMAHPLDADGEPLLPEPILLDSGLRVEHPAVAWDGTRYLVVWEDDDAARILGQRLLSDGTPVDAGPFIIMEGFRPDVAALDGVFLVVDIQITFDIERQEPFAVRVDGATGTVLGSPVDIGDNHTRHVSVAAFGDRWIVAYQRNFSHDDPNAEVHANFVEASGAAGSEFIVASALNPFYYTPEVASDGAAALVAWVDSVPGEDDVRAARVSSDGSVGPPFTVSGAFEEQNEPALAWDGTQYVALYEDLRDATFFLDERSDVFGTRLTADGTVLDPAGFPVFDTEVPEIGPAVTGAGGVALLAASVFHDGAYRVACRFLGQTTAPVAVTVEPVSPPVVIPPGGGSFQFTVTLTNTTAEPQAFQAWTEVTGPVNREPVLGPRTVTLPPGATVTRTLTQRVPGAAPPGTYTYAVNVGEFPSTVRASDAFAFEKEGATPRGAASDADWAVSGWDEAPAASAALPDSFVLSEAHPNPFTRHTTLALDLAEGQHVRAEVFDALGRRVAVLADGEVEAGTHALVLEGAELPAGVYVVRVTGETFSATRRATRLR